MSDPPPRKKKPTGPPKPWDYLGWQGDQPTIDDLPSSVTATGMSNTEPLDGLVTRSYWNRWDAGEPMADLFHEAEAEIERLKAVHARLWTETRRLYNTLLACGLPGGEGARTDDDPDGIFTPCPCTPCGWPKCPCDRETP